MADIRPFRGIRYNPAKMKDLSQVITQPYDKITPETAEGVLPEGRRSSFVRLILADGAGPVCRLARRRSTRGSADSTLIRDPQPAFYVIHQEFEVNGEKKLRKGFIGAVRVEKFEKGAVLPHERTLSKPKADRLNLPARPRRTTSRYSCSTPTPRASSDKALAVEGKPLMEATDDYGVTQKVWAVTDPKKIAAVEQALATGDAHRRRPPPLRNRAQLPPGDRGGRPRSRSTRPCGSRPPRSSTSPTPASSSCPPTGCSTACRRSTGPRRRRSWRAGSRCTGSPTSCSPRKWRGASGWANTCSASTRARARPTSCAWPTSGRWSSSCKDRSDDYRGLDVAILHTLIIDQVFGVPAEKIEDHVAYERKVAKQWRRSIRPSSRLRLLMNPTRAEQVQRGGRPRRADAPEVDRLLPQAGLGARVHGRGRN